MTIRDHLSQKRRNISLAAFACWLVFAIATVMAPHSGKPGPPLLIFPAFIGFMGCILFMLFGLRCPQCRNNLGYTIQWPASWGVSEKLKYCPFCGVEFDKEMKDLNKANVVNTKSRAPD